MGIYQKIRNFFLWLKPPGRWHLPVIILLGIFTGLALYVLRISNAPSYLSDDPGACINCHVMNPQYASWYHSSHREVAHCNDCHVPHDNFINKYYFKAKDGLRHATIFTLRNEPQVIMILEAGKKVVQQNCIRCHEYLLKDNNILAVMPGYDFHRTERECWECHRETPHGRVSSLSAAPHARIPELEDPVPAWLENLISGKKQQ